LKESFICLANESQKTDLSKLLYVYHIIPLTIFETVGDGSVGILVVFGCSSGDGIG
jgi:hypothetical protein